jgi:autotransporter-associated beta strand protein
LAVGNGVNGAVIIRHALANANRTNGATLKVQSGTGVVSIGGNIANLSNLLLDSSSAINLTGAISGTGALSKLNANTLTLTGLASYTGSTEVMAGGIVLTNNVAPATSGFTGAGTVVIEPSTSFTSAVTSAYNFASTLTGLRLGKENNTQSITISSAIGIAGPVSLYGGGITINHNIDTRAGGLSGNVLLKSSGDISVATTKSITTRGGDVVLWSNSDNQASNGSILLYGGSSITTGGGHLWMAGGAASATTWHGLTVGDGYAVSGTVISGTGNAANFGQVGVFMEEASLSTGGGDIYIRGKTTTFRGFLATGTVDINAGSGKIYIEGLAVGDGAGAGAGWHHSPGTAFRNGIFTLTSSNADADAIVWLSDATQSIGTGLASDGAGEGAGLAGTTSLMATGTGGISFTSLGSSTKAGAFGVRLGYLAAQGGVLNLLAASGDITLNTGARSVGIVNNLGSATLGAKGGTAVLASSSNIAVVSDDVSASGTMAFNTSGQLTIKPREGYSFTSTFDTTKLTYQGGVSGLFIGHSTNTGNVTVNSSTTIAGPIEIYGGTLTVNAPLVATNSSIIKLKGSTITDGASGYITADKLALLGGTVTLDNASNSVNTLAASGVGALTFVNASAMTLGTVNPTGITATGDVRIETLSGDLTIAQNVTTTSTTANAVLLNAGKSAAAGTAAGGNILISGTPSITAGVGGTVRLMGGSVADSAGLTDLVGSGTGRFRYNSDESATNFTLALGPNVVNAIYREQPTANATIDSYTVTYGFDHTLTLASLKPNGTSPLSTSRSAVNGDDSVAGLGVLIEGATYSTAGKLNYRVTPYTLTDGLAKLGYAMQQSGGSLLTVEKKAVNLVGFVVDNKVYDGNANATFSGAVTLGALETNDVATFTSATGTFADRHVGTKLVTVTGVVMAGADKDNYSVTLSSGNASATISQRASVTWVGGSGSWSDASNWAVTGNLGQTGVLPDGANVAVAVLPVGFAGTLTSSYAHAHEGNIVVNGGTLAVAADAYLGATTPAAVANRITLNGGSLQATDSFTLNPNRGITLGVSGGTFVVDSSQSVNYAGVMANTGGLTKLGSGTLTLSGANTYSGGTTIDAGQLVAGGTSTALGTSTVTVSGTRLSFDTAAPVTYANPISMTGAGLLDNIGSYRVTFTGGVNTNRTNFANTTVVDGGTAGVTIANLVTPSGAGASYFIKGNLTFTGNSFNGLVIRAAGESTATFTLTNGVSTFTPWFIGGDTEAYAMNIQVDAGVTVREDPAQAAASLYYKNITGAGTFNMGGANNTTGYVMGDATIATFISSGTKKISIGNGGNTGRLLSGDVQANGGLVLDSSLSYAYSGVQSVGTLTKQGAGTVTLTNANISPSNITISNGILQVGAAGTTGSIAGNTAVAAGAGLVFSRSNAMLYGGNISGLGTVSKLGNNVLTLTGTQSYTGATATGDAGGGLVFTNNTRPSTLSFTGNGTLTIQPAAASSFGAALNTSAYSFADTLTGLTLGHDENTATLTVDSVLRIAGPISVVGGTVNLNANITSTAANALVLFKSAADIAQAANVAVQTQGGSAVYWANSDGGNSAGMVLLNTGASITTQGGHVWLGGSATPNGQAVWHGLTVGNGYAASGTSVVFAGGPNWQGGIVLKRSQISTAGGDISLYGYGAAGGSGFVNFDNTLLDAGAGQILIDAKSVGIAAFLPGLHPSVLPNEVLELRSANTGVNAIRVITDGVATPDPGAVIEGNFKMNAIAGGGVTLSGRAAAGVAGIQVGSVWGSGVMDALSTSGNIALDAGTNSISFQNAASAIYLGSKAGSAVTAATGHIRLTADSLSLASALTYANTAGTLTIAPTSASFTSAVNSTGWVLGTGLSALTVGSPTNTANITWSSSNTVNGPISIHGGDITLNSAIGTTDTSTGDVLLRGDHINSAFGISVADGRSLTVSNTADSTLSGVVSGANVRLIKLQTGVLNLTVNHTYSGGTTVSAGTLVAGNAATSGALGTGDITNNGVLIFKRSDAITVADVISGTGMVKQEGTGSLTLSAINAYEAGTQVNAGTLAISTDRNLGAVPVAVDANNLVLNGGSLRFMPGFTTLHANRGLQLGAGNGTLNTDAAVSVDYAGVISGAGALTKAGAGSFTLNAAQTYTGTTTVSAGTLVVGDGSNTTAALSTNAINVASGSTLKFNHSADVTLVSDVRGAGDVVKLDAHTLTLTGLASYTGSTATGAGGGWVFTNDVAPTTSGFSGAGFVTIQPASASFSAAVNSNYAFATTLSALTLGKAGNTANVTLNTVTDVAGPITVYATQATFNQAVHSGADLVVNGQTRLNGSTVTTTGAQLYNGAVTLGANTTLTTAGVADVTFVSTLNGGYDLTVNSAGATVFGGAVGGLVPLTSITTDAAGRVAIEGGSVITTGAQTYNERLSLGADTTLQGVNLALLSTVNGAHSLTLNDSGTTVLGDVVGGSVPLISLTTDALGQTHLKGAAIHTSLNAVFNDIVTVFTDVQVQAAGQLSFTQTIDDNLANTHTLTLNGGSTAAVAVEGAIGATLPLKTLTLVNSESTTFTCPVTTGTSVLLQDTGLSIAFQGGLNTPALSVAAKPFDLHLSGQVHVNDALTLANTGLVQLGALASDDMHFVGGLVATAPRAIDMAGVLRTTDQAIHLGHTGAPITLLANTDIDSGTGSLRLASTVSAGDNEYVLRILSTGATTVDGNMTSAGALSFVGALTFSSLNATVNAASMTFGGAVTALGNLTIHGPTYVNGGAVSSGLFTQTYDGDVTVGGAGPITTFTGVGLTFGAALNGTGRVVVADSGNTTYSGAIGTVAAPLHFETSAAGSSTFSGGTVRTSGPNSMLIADDVVITQDTTFDTTNNAALPTGANITFGKTLNGSVNNTQSVTINAGTGGTVRVAGTVGNTHPLHTLTLVNSHDTTFNAAVTTGVSVVLSNTAAGQTIRFEDNLSTGSLLTTGNGYHLELLGANTSVSAATTFLNTGSLTLGNAANDVLTFAGGLVATAPSSISLGGTVNTTNTAMTLGDGNTALTLADHLTLNTAGGALSLNGAVDGTLANTQSLTLNAGSAGVVSVTGDVGQTTSLHTLTLSHSHGATFTHPVIADTAVVLSNTAAGQTIRFEDNLSTGSLLTTGNGYHLELLGANTSVMC